MYNGDGLRTEKWGDRTTQYIILDGTYLGEKTTFYGGTTYLITYIYGAEGSVIGLDVNGTAYYFVKNLQGDVTSIIDVNGNILANYSYDAYGYSMGVTDGNGNEVTSATHIANLNPFRYRSYFYDQETGFYYLRSRYYDPAVCRFLNADGYVSTGTGFIGYNMFAYCDDNPIIYKDSTGRIKKFAFGEKYDLGHGWYARFDEGKVGNASHVHVWKDGDEWIMNLDGSMSHKNKSNKGNPPSKPLKKLKEMTGFDYKKKRKNFLKNDDALIGTKGLTNIVYYSDGTIYSQGEYYYTNNGNTKDTVYEVIPLTTPLSFVYPLAAVPTFVGPPLPIFYSNVVYGPLLA